MLYKADDSTPTVNSLPGKTGSNKGKAMLQLTSPGKTAQLASWKKKLIRRENQLIIPWPAVLQNKDVLSIVHSCELDLQTMAEIPHLVI